MFDDMPNVDRILQVNKYPFFSSSKPFLILMNFYETDILFTKIGEEWSCKVERRMENNMFLFIPNFIALP